MPRAADPYVRPSRRRATTIVSALGLLAGGLGLFAAGAAPSEGATTRTIATLAAPAPAPVSQKPGIATNGIRYYQGEVWICDAIGGELFRIDAETGVIKARYGKGQGVENCDDLVVASDGSVYWTGIWSGLIGHLEPKTGRSTTIAKLDWGVNAITLGPDGMLYVSRLFLGDGIYRVDPTTGATKLVAPGATSNGFSFGSDGMLYGPSNAYLTGGSILSSSLERYDPATGARTTVATVPGAVFTGARFKPTANGGIDGRTAYVLSGLNPTAVFTVDIATGRADVLPGKVLSATADNLAFAPDGRLFVSGLFETVFTIINPDGTSRKVQIGQP